MSGWLTELRRQYDVDVLRYVPTPRGVWLETNRGPMMLQSIPEAYVHKAEFVYEMNQAFQRSMLMPPIVESRSGGIVSEIRETPYVLMGWPAAELNAFDYRELGSALARFHCESAKLMEGKECPFSEYGLWPRIWRAKIERAKSFEAIAMERLGSSEEDPFDSFFLDNSQYLFQLASQALACLQAVEYEQICADARGFGRLSYVNFGFEKFVVAPGGRLFFADPFALVEDTRARDIAQFIKADARAHGWRPFHTQAFLTAYHEVSSLTSVEFQLIYALLLLPGRLLKKLESLYFRPSIFRSNDWRVALFKAETDRMTPDLAYLEMRRTETLIKEFPTFIQRCFGARIVL